MVRTPSSLLLPIGSPLPAFRLSDLDGREVDSGQFRGAPGLLVAFICNHCPFVQHIRPQLAAFAREYVARGLAMVGIMSNDTAAFPEDGPEGMAWEVRTFGYVFPYLLDGSQEVAKAFRAACTPDLCLFDREGRLVYQGQFDGSRPGNGLPVTGESLRAAADAVLEGRPVAVASRASVGCNIKWKPGHEPEY